VAIVAALLSCAAGARAAGGDRPRGLRATLAPEGVRIDGVPREWSGEWRALDVPARGSLPGAADASGRVHLAYDAQSLYLAAEVRDDKLVGGGDHLELLLGIPGGKIHAIRLYPGVPGKSAAVARGPSGAPVRGARTVEAPSEGGWSLEAAIPWSAIPDSATVRIGYRGAVLLHDVDAGGEKVIGTTRARGYADLPPLSTEPELALGAGLLREKGLRRPPRHNLLADVVGDARRERVLVYGRYLVVLGHGYRRGEEYYWRDLGADADAGGLLGLEVADRTGDGKADLFVRKRLRIEGGTLELAELLSFHGGADPPERVFAHEVALALDGGGRLTSEVELVGLGAKARIVVRAAEARGVDRATFSAGPRSDAEPLLLPWGAVASRTFVFRGKRFEPESERGKAGHDPEEPAPPPAPPPLVPAASRPAAPAAGNGGGAVVIREKRRDGADLEAVYALYRKERGASGAPRFDLRADLAEDAREERLVVHGRDLVAFGEGFKGGRGYSAAELPVARPEDVVSVAARDVTGDGKSEIVARLLLRAPLPAEVGEGEAERTVVAIFRLRAGHFERVFGAEIARRVGDRRVEASLAFSREAGAGVIELRPGRAVGYSRESYPWRQRTEPLDGFEPLLLPWGGLERVRLRWDGNAFVRAPLP
jgi:hypothetical protein